MSHKNAIATAVILNLFSLNVSFSQDLYQEMKKNPGQNVDQVRARTHDTARIKRVNELNAAIKTANPPPKTKYVGEPRPATDNTPDDEGDKVPESEKKTPNPEAKTRVSDSHQAHGYIRNGKGPDSNPTPHPIKVKTDDTPESLSFPGTND